MKKNNNGINASCMEKNEMRGIITITETH